MAGCSASGAAQTATAPARSMTSSASTASATSLPSRRPQPERITPTRLAIRSIVYHGVAGVYHGVAGVYHGVAGVYHGVAGNAPPAAIASRARRAKLK